jgi:hypothetical protein
MRASELAKNLDTFLSRRMAEPRQIKEPRRPASLSRRGRVVVHFIDFEGGRHVTLISVVSIILGARWAEIESAKRASSRHINQPWIDAGWVERVVAGENPNIFADGEIVSADGAPEVLAFSSTGCGRRGCRCRHSFWDRGVGA